MHRFLYRKHFSLLKIVQVLVKHRVCRCCWLILADDILSESRFFYGSLHNLSGICIPFSRNTDINIHRIISNSPSLIPKLLIYISEEFLNISLLSPSLLRIYIQQSHLEISNKFSLHTACFSIKRTTAIQGLVLSVNSENSRRYNITYTICIFYRLYNICTFFLVTYHSSTCTKINTNYQFHIHTY